MSGFVERVVEDWLINSDERSYQLPFASYLSRSGHKVKYVSGHSTLEHGKDIVTISPDKKLHAYQLKVGKITLQVWRRISDEVRETATVPVQVPGMPTRVPERAFLVTTGRLSDPARSQLTLINQDHRNRGYAEIGTVELDELVADFAAVFESFFPATIDPLHALVKLYLADGRGPQSKDHLFGVLQSVIREPSGPRIAGRSLSNLVVAAEFAAAPYRRAKNHISVIDTWVIAACHVLLLARRLSLHPRHWKQSMRFCQQAIEAAGSDLLAEGFSGDHFTEGDPLIDAAFSPYRKLVALGYMGAVINSRCIQEQEVRPNSARLLEILDPERPLGIWGEGAWNHYFNLALALRHTPDGAAAAEAMVASWLAYVCPRRPPWPKDPYWTVDDEVSLSRQREESTREEPERSRLSYTAAAATGFLARRMLRNTVKWAWPALSRYQLAQLAPAEPWMELDWAVENGSLELHILPVTGSWSKLRAEAAAQRNSLFEEHESWLLPYFLCVYPHRTTAALSGELDFLTSPHSFRSEWTN